MAFRTIRAMFRRLLAVALVAALVGCGGDDGGDGPSATIGAADPDPMTTSTTEALTPEEEVEAAYLKSWEIYAEAVRQLDLSGADAVYANAALTTLQEEIGRHRQNGTTVLVEVEHNYEISILETGRAIVLDEYVNHSRLSDEHGNPIEPDPNETITELYTLLKLDGQWKVIGFERQ